MTTLTHARYMVTLPGHYFPGATELTFDGLAFLFNGGNTPSENKKADPGFAARVNSAIDSLKDGKTVSHSCGTVWGITREDYQRTDGPLPVVAEAAS